MNAALVGVVVIGRNEGERLRLCLLSARAVTDRLVYVDSDSRDGSVALAAGLGVEVVALDMGLPFSAARARNAGWRRLREHWPDLACVQFVDGDCELVTGWLHTAMAFMAANPQCVVVCGRRRERYPRQSLYNLLCDLEWDTLVGEAKACGGDALMRLDKLAAVDGFRDDVVAGEEPELCLRLRQQGGRVFRIDAEMTWHDAAMSRWGQWWRRTQRWGHACAQAAAIHGTGPERHGVAPMLRALLWGLLLPLVIAAAVWVWGPLCAAGLLVYPLQVLRLACRQAPGQRHDARTRSWQALFFVLGRFPEAMGVMQYVWAVSSKRGVKLIEYK